MDNGTQNGNYYLRFRAWGRMITRPPPFKGLKIRITIIMRIRSRFLFDEGSTLCASVKGNISSMKGDNVGIPKGVHVSISKLPIVVHVSLLTCLEGTKCWAKMVPCQSYSL